MRRSRGTARGAEQGSSSIEFAGVLPLLLFTAVAVIQLGVAGYTVQQAGTAARAAARTAGDPGAEPGPAAAGRAAMSPWTASRAAFSVGGGDDEVTVTATVTIPSVVPGIDDFGTASRSVTMPADR